MTTTGLDPFSRALVATPSALPLLVILLKITCVLLVALGATIAMQRMAASTRHLIWLVALVALMLVPPLALWSPLPIRVLPAAFAPAAAVEAERASQLAGSAESVAPAAPESFPLSGEGAGTRTEANAGQPWSPARILLTIWVIVAVTLTARLGYGAWSVRRIVRRARPLEDPSWQTPLFEIADRLGLDAAPALLRSDDVKMPFAAGLFTSMIVLPAESDGWSAERRSAVLIHELGHVRRRDLIGHTLSRVACAVYWFHPLVWTAARQLRAESERACDDLALVFGARPSDYAEHLLDIVTCVRDHNTPAVALAMAHRREFEGRMLAILNPELRRRGPGRLETVSLVGSLGVLAVFVGAATPVARGASVPEYTPPSESAFRGFMQDTVQRQEAVPQSPTHPVPVAKPMPNPTPRPVAEPSPAVDPSDGRVPDDERAAVLARTLRTDSNAGVRRVAAWGLQRYAQVDVAVDALVNAVLHDKEASVREMSAWALQRARRNSAASAAVARAITGDQDASVRATAVWVAGEIGDAGALGALVQATKDADPEFREMAAWSIGNIRPESVPPALLKLLADRERDVRMAATWAVYTIKDPAALSAVKAAYDRETDADVRGRLIWALGGFSEASVAILDSLITSGDDATREAAVNQLAKRGDGGPWPWPRPQPRPFP